MLLQLGRNVDLVDVAAGLARNAGTAGRCALTDLPSLDAALASTRPDENGLLGGLAPVTDLTGVLLNGLTAIVGGRLVRILGPVHDKGAVDVTARLVELDGLPGVFGSL